MITKTVGSGGDFSTITAWVAWVQANAVTGGNLTDHVTCNILATGISPTVTDTVTGWAPGGSNFTTTIQAVPGGSFRDNANVQTNALLYNTANGAFVDYGTHNAWLEIAVAKATVRNLQFRQAQNYRGSIKAATASAGIDVANCIFYANAANGALGIIHDAPLTVKNSLFHSSLGGTFGGGTSGQAGTPTLLLQNCTFYQGYRAVGLSRYAGSVIQNCVFIATVNADVWNDRVTMATGSNNATTRSAWSAWCNFTASTLSITAADEFVSATVDFRLKSTSSVLKNGGATLAGLTDDIAGSVRDASFDIGAWEYMAPVVLATGAGDSSGTSTVDGVGAAVVYGTGSGAADGTSTVDGVGQIVLSAVGAADGSSSVLGVSSVIVTAVGLSTDTAFASATPNVISQVVVEAVGNAWGSSTVDGAGTSVVELVGPHSISKTHLLMVIGDDQPLQDFTLTAGDSRTLVVTVTDDDGVVVDLTNCALVWSMARTKLGPVLVRKDTTSGIRITNDIGGVAEVDIVPYDTALLFGARYYHEVEITDVWGEVSTVGGYMRLRTGLIGLSPSPTIITNQIMLEDGSGSLALEDLSEILQEA